MNHVLYGATIPFAIGALIYLLRGCRANVTMLVLVPLSMALMALWANLPDIPRMLGYHDLYGRLASDPRMNIFLWHYALDQMETSTQWYSALELESPWQTVGVALEAAAIMGVAIRQLFIKEKS